MKNAPRSLAAVALATGIGCNIDYNLLGEGNGAQSGVDSGGMYDDTGDFETGYLDGDTADTGWEDPIDETGDPSGDDMPDYPFSSVIDACTGLDESGCPVDLTTGAQVEECVANANYQMVSILSQITDLAREVAGDETLTYEDVRAGAVPATLTAAYKMHEAGFNGDDVMSEYAWMILSFGYNGEAHEQDLSIPYDKTSVTTVRCFAQNYAPLDDVENMQGHTVSNFVKEADTGTTLAGLSISDYADYSNSISVYDKSYDNLDSSLYTEPGYYELADETDAVLNAAYTITSGGLWDGTYYYN